MAREGSFKGSSGDSEVGLKVGVLGTSFSNRGPHKLLRQQDKRSNSTRTSRFNVTETGHRKSISSIWPRLLQPNICGAKAKWQMAPNNRSFKTEQVAKDSNIPDGIHPICLESTSARELYVLNRLDGRILSHSHTPQVQKVPKILFQREGVSVQGTSLRPKHSSVHLHSSDVGGQGHDTPERGTTVPLPGRLASPDTDISGRTQRVRAPPSSRHGAGAAHKQRKVRVDPISDFCLYRRLFQAGYLQGLSEGGKPTKASGKTQGVSSSILGDGQKLPKVTGDGVIPVSLLPLREVVLKATTVASSIPVGSARGKPSGLDFHQSTNESLPQVVVSPDRESCRGTTEVTGVLGEYLHRCIRTGLGGTCTRCSGNQIPGSLVEPRKRTSQQCSGDEGCSISSRKSDSPSGQCHPHFNRQYHGKVTHKQTRRNKVLVSHGRDSPPISVGNQKQLAAESATHSRQIECVSGQSVQGRTDSSDRVVTQPGSSRPGIRKVAQATHRPVCHKGKQKMSNVCFPIPTSRGISSRCLDIQLPRSGSVCLPSGPDISEDSREISDGDTLLSYSNRPLVAETNLVSHVNAACSGTSIPAAANGESAKAAKFQYLSPATTGVESSRLVAEEDSLKLEGFNDEVAKRISNPLAKSTSKVYDAKWKIWNKWCNDKKRDPSKPDVPQVASFLNDLFNNGHSVSSITGYRAALASALRFSSDIDISNSVELSKLVQFFTRTRPPRSTLIPKWDLAIVLWTLMEPPFEPIWDPDKVPLKFLTWKVAFLLLLASGARRGELHAIKLENVTYPKDFAHVTLRPDPGFLSKTRLTTGKALDPFVIPSLSDSLGPDLKQDRKLCPVRAVKTYLHRTPKEFRKNRKLLLVSYSARGDNTDKDISVNTLSSWISDLIQFCYKNPGNLAISLSGRSTHEIRAYAASLVHKGSWAMEDVLASGQWSNNLTFIDHYLRDLTEQQGPISRLGPIVAGQKVVRL